MTPEERLDALDITLPPPPAPAAAYRTWCRSGRLVMTSGQLPWHNGVIAYAGTLGTDLTTEQGRAAARLCGINALAQLKAAAGTLDRIEQVLRLDGCLQTAPGYADHPGVLDGASDLFNEIFGDRGVHTRTLLTTANMPLNAAVQLSVTATFFKETPTMAFAHFTLPTRDIESSKRFLMEVMGWSVIDRPANIAVPAAWMRIAEDQEAHLLQFEDFEPSAWEKEYGRHIAFEVPRSRFPEIKARISALGGEVIPPSRDTTFERFFFREPGGLCFEIMDADRDRQPA